MSGYSPAVAVFASLLCLGQARLASAETQVVEFETIHPATNLAMTLTTNVAGYTQPYVPWNVFVRATLETDELSVTSFRFDVAFTDSNVNTFEITELFMGNPIDGETSVQSPFAVFTVGETMPAIPNGSGASTFDLAPIDYSIIFGQLVFSIILVPGEPPVPAGSTELSDEPMVFPLAGSANIRLIPNHTTLTTEVVLTLPLTATANPPHDNFDLSGNLVLVGVLPLANQALPLPPGVAWIAALLLAYTGRRMSPRLSRFLGRGGIKPFLL